LNIPTFRLADPQDAALVQTISAEAYVPAYQPVMGYVPKPAIEDYSEWIRGQNVWIAEIDGEPSGVLVLEPSANYLTIYSIAVLPNRQGFGLGRSLLSFAADRARATGLPEVRLYTNRRMERNVALYRAAGFVEVGSHPHPSRAGEILVDMAKTSGGIPQDQSK
jgi:ribosomal protein S18 acetylase RimI-like enzyme